MKKIFVLLAFALISQQAFSEVVSESTEKEENYSFSYDTEEAKRNIATDEEKAEDQESRPEEEKTKKSYFKEMKYWKY